MACSTQVASASNVAYTSASSYSGSGQLQAGHWCIAVLRVDVLHFGFGTVLSALGVWF